MLLKPKNNREIAKREDGQLLILPSRNPEEVGALSDPTQGYYNPNRLLNRYNVDPYGEENFTLRVYLLFEE